MDPETNRVRLIQPVIEVLEENWETFEVYQRCQHTFAGMAGLPIGFSASEVASAMAALRVPRRRQREVLDGVQLMGRVQARVLSERRPKTEGKK